MSRIQMDSLIEAVLRIAGMLWGMWLWKEMWIGVIAGLFGGLFLSHWVDERTGGN